jgi:hypothetical protein
MEYTEENIFDWYNLQPIDNPLSECFGCEANMCDYGSRIPYCTMDQYDYKAGNWKPNFEDSVNRWREMKLNEILNEES